MFVESSETSTIINIICSIKIDDILADLQCIILKQMLINVLQKLNEFFFIDMRKITITCLEFYLCYHMIYIF